MYLSLSTSTEMCGLMLRGKFSEDYPIARGISDPWPSSRSLMWWCVRSKALGLQFGELIDQFAKVSQPPKASRS